MMKVKGVVDRNLAQMGVVLLKLSWLLFKNLIKASSEAETHVEALWRPRRIPAATFLWSVAPFEGNE